MLKYAKTLYGKVSFVLFFTLLFSVIVIGVHSRTISRYNQEQLLSKTQEEIAVYASIMNTSFSLLEENLFYLPSYNQYFQTLLRYDTDRERDTPEYWACVSNIQRQLSTLHDLSSYAESFFAYYPEQNLFLNDSVNPEMVNLIKAAISDSGSTFTLQWNHTDLSGGSYLYRIFAFRSFYLGVWIRCEELPHYFFSSASHSSVSKNHILLYDYSGVPLLPGSPSISIDLFASPLVLSSDNTYFLSGFSEQPGIYLARILPAAAFSAMKPYNIASFFMVCLLHLLLLLFLLCGMTRWVLHPVKELSSGIRRIRNGEITYRMPEAPQTSTEFREMKREFNSMMDKTQEMKIQMYEQQLRQNEVQLRYLSQQIQPHFILNSLNTLYAHIGDDDSSRQIVLLLVQYYRYIIRIESPWVRIGEELDHIQNYLSFQQIRYVDRLSYTIDCNENCRSTPIPPLLLESFVGNCLKYGQDEDDQIELNLEVNQSDASFTRLLISDHGSGFPDEVIDGVKKYRTTGEKSPLLGIGICNSMDRLSLLYDEKASLYLYNCNGAVVEIMIPSESKKMGKDENTREPEFNQRPSA